MLTLICGLPRAGKTTFSDYFSNVIHLDTDGLYIGVIFKVKRSTGNIVVEGVYNTQRLRKELLCAFNKTDEKVCFWLDTAEHIRQERTKAKMQNLVFEPPTYAEGWDEIIIVRDGIETKLER